MSIPDELLMAYVDGELGAEERARVEAAMRTDAEVARRVEQQRALRANLRAAFDGVLREPVPDRLLAAARGETVTASERENSRSGSTSAQSEIRDSPGGHRGSVDERRGSYAAGGDPADSRRGADGESTDGRTTVSDFTAAAKARSAARESRDVPRMSHRWSWPEWGAMAASLVIGVVVAQFAMRSPESAPFTSQQGRLLAQGDLARTLSEQLASAQARDADTSVGVSFRAKGGGYCRSFTMRSSSTAGLACREGGSWRIDVLARTDTPSGQYTQAGSALPAAVLNAIEQQIEGDPLDAAAEARAKDSGWRSPPAR